MSYMWGCFNQAIWLVLRKWRGSRYVVDELRRLRWMRIQRLLPYQSLKLWVREKPGSALNSTWARKRSGWHYFGTKNANSAVLSAQNVYNTRSNNRNRWVISSIFFIGLWQTKTRLVLRVLHRRHFLKQHELARTEFAQTKTARKIVFLRRRFSSSRGHCIRPAWA